MKLSIITLALFTLAGCASPAARPDYYTWSGTSDGLVLAQAAAKEWNDVCGITPPVVVTDAPDGLALEEHPCCTLDPTDPTTIGEEWPDGHVAVLRLPDPRREQTAIAHELGHALGIEGHTPDTVMEEDQDPKVPARHVTSKECALLPF